MTAADLDALPKAELIALILRLQTRIGELEEKSGRPPKTPANSSVPPSQARTPNRPPPAAGSPRPGARPGHVGTTRPFGEPTARIALRVAQCAGCGTDLRTAAQAPVERRQVIDLPPIAPEIVEAVVHRVTCPDCGRAQTAAFPAAFPAPVRLGPGVQALATYLHEVHHVAYARLATLLAEVFGLTVSPGSLVALVQRTGAALRPDADAIGDQVRARPVIGSDETSMRIDGRTAWQWVFQTPEATYLVSATSRGSQVIRDMLGDAQPEVWVSDLYSAQQTAPAQRFQVCIAHQLRNLAFAVDCGDHAFAPAMAELFRAALSLHAARPELDLALFARLRLRVEAECDRLLVTDTAHREGLRLQWRYRDHRTKLFVFLERDDVPPDNNGSERAVRTTVVHRKVTGCFRSDWGADNYSTIMTVIETAKKRGQGLLDTVRAAIEPFTLPPLPIPHSRTLVA